MDYELMLELILPIDFSLATSIATACARAAMAEISPRDLKRIASGGHFEMEIRNASFDYTIVSHYDHSLLQARGLDPSSWDSLVRTSSAITSLISARVFEENYEKWENAEDPLEFEANGMSMRGLPTRSNGLPPPLEQTIVDTSRNPGRRILRNGYVEAVGHIFWLGPEFFRRVPRSDAHRVGAADWCSVSRRDSLIKVQVPGPFVDRSSAVLQERLRDLLFG